MGAMSKLLLKLLAQVFFILIALLAIVLAMGIGVGYILYWLLPDMRLDIAVLTSVVAISSLFVFGAVLFRTPLSFPLPDDYNYDNDDDNPSYQPTYNTKNERDTKSKKRRKR